MKIFHLYLLFTLVLFTGCNAQQSHLQITYEAQSRGFYEKSEVMEDTLIIYEDRNIASAKKIKLDQNQQKEIRDLVKELKQTSATAMDTRSDRSQVDAAIPARLQILSGSKKTEFQFDRDNPPKKLKRLIEWMQPQRR